jgi:hypothetical protein
MDFEKTFIKTRVVEWNSFYIDFNFLFKLLDVFEEAAIKYCPAYS